MSTSVHPYSMVAGVVVGMLCAGLLVPLAFDSSADERAAPAAESESVDDSALGTGGAVGSVDGQPGQAADGGPAPDTASADATSDNEGSGQPAEAGELDFDGGSGDGGQETQGGGSDGQDDGGSSGESLTASDTGVTPETVRVGLLFMDLGGIAELGAGVDGSSREEQERAYDAFIEEANNNGGLNGRQIETYKADWDPVDPETARAACRKLAEDDEVFGVISFAVFGDGLPCMTEQYGLPVLNSVGTIEEFYERGDGLLFTTGLSMPRAGRNEARMLDQHGILADKTVGILTSEGTGYATAVANGTEPKLRELGKEVEHKTVLPQDYAAGSSQIPVAVNQMQAKGVDLVFMSTNFIYASQFSQQADSQRYYPLYSMSELSGAASDYFLESMADSTEAVGTNSTRQGDLHIDAPEPEIDADCRETYSEITGNDVERSTEDEEYGVVLGACGQVRQFVHAARKAGPELTRRGWADEMANLGRFAMPNSPGGSYGPQKYDAPDYVRPLRADMDCRCFIPVGDYISAID